MDILPNIDKGFSVRTVCCYWKKHTFQKMTKDEVDDVFDIVQEV